MWSVYTTKFKINYFILNLIDGISVIGVKSVSHTGHRWYDFSCVLMSVKIVCCDKIWRFKIRSRNGLGFPSFFCTTTFICFLLLRYFFPLIWLLPGICFWSRYPSYHGVVCWIPGSSVRTSSPLLLWHLESQEPEPRVRRVDDEHCCVRGPQHRLEESWVRWQR